MSKDPDSCRRARHEANFKSDAATRLIQLKICCHREKVAALRRAAEEKVMRTGSTTTVLVSQVAALDTERAKLVSLRLKAAAYGVSLGEDGDSDSDVAGVRDGGGTDVPGVEAATQVEDDAEALRAVRDRLLDATRNMPKNTANMVELLKKRNAVLLAREERALQRARAERLAKEQRLLQLQLHLRQLEKRLECGWGPPPR